MMVFSQNRWRGTSSTGDDVLLPCCSLALSTPSAELPSQDNRAAITPPRFAAGSCPGKPATVQAADTLLGEGAYFAPELGSVPKRRGGDHQGLDAGHAYRSPGRRQMPQFNLTDEERRPAGGLPESTLGNQHCQPAAQHRGADRNLGDHWGYPCNTNHKRSPCPAPSRRSVCSWGKSSSA